MTGVKLYRDGSLNDISSINATVNVQRIDGLEQIYPIPASLPTDGLVTFYTFDDDTVSSDGTTVSEVSGNGYSASINGALTGQEGVNGQSFYFDGVDDEVKTDLHPIDDHSIWAEGNTGTAACWFKFDSSIGGDNVNSKFFVYPGEWGTHPQSIQSGDGLFSPRIDVYGDNNLPLTDSLQTGVWYHLAFTLDQPNGTISVYINGTAVAQTTGVGAPSVERENYFLIGNSESDTEDPFHGWLDELGVWSRILSDSEIRGLYRRGTPP